jgi:hypothetical protein
VAAPGRKTGIVFGVLLLMLCGVLVAADRIGLSLAENTISDQAAKEMSARSITSASAPQVSIGGFPFLTQVLRGRYDKVTIDVDHPQSGSIKLDKLTLVANNLHAPIKTVTSGQGQITADVVTGTATIGWQAIPPLLELAGLPGVDISTVKITVVDNQIRLRVPMVVAGFSMTATVVGTLAVANGVVRVDVTQLIPEGSSIPAYVTQAVSQLRQKLSVHVNVPAFPYKLTIKKVDTTDTGIIATASAEQVPLAA